MAERFQEFGALYGDLHCNIRSQQGVAKVTRRAAFGKAGLALGRHFPAVPHSNSAPRP
jgi:hypothetical protein